MATTTTASGARSDSSRASDVEANRIPPTEDGYLASHRRMCYAASTPASADSMVDGDILLRTK